MAQKCRSTVVQPPTKRGAMSMYKTGEKPGMGVYVCLECGQIVRLDDNTDVLPPCPKCSNTTYRKY